MRNGENNTEKNRNTSDNYNVVNYNAQGDDESHTGSNAEDQKDKRISDQHYNRIDDVLRVHNMLRIAVPADGNSCITATLSQLPYSDTTPNELRQWICDTMIAHQDEFLEFLHYNTDIEARVRLFDKVITDLRVDGARPSFCTL